MLSVINILNNRNLFTTLHTPSVIPKWDIGRKLWFFHTPPAFDTQLRGSPIWLLPQRLVQENKNGGSTRRWKKFENIFTRTIHECDRRTDSLWWYRRHLQHYNMAIQITPLHSRNTITNINRYYNCQLEHSSEQCRRTETANRLYGDRCFGPEIYRDISRRSTGKSTWAVILSLQIPSYLNLHHSIIIDYHIDTTSIHLFHYYSLYRCRLIIIITVAEKQTSITINYILN